MINNEDRERNGSDWQLKVDRAAILQPMIVFRRIGFFLICIALNLTISPKMNEYYNVSVEVECFKCQFDKVPDFENLIF